MRLPGRLGRLTPAQALVALQIGVIVACGAATVARFPVWALVDERAHYANVQVLAEEGRLAVLGRDRVSPEVQAIDEGVYPAPPRRDPRDLGLGGFAYEAFQPPLYYGLAVPAFLVVADHEAKLRVLRSLDLAILLLTAGVLFLLARRAAPGAALVTFSLGLTVLMWPGVVVRAVTVSNAGLEMLLGLGVLLALWRAVEDDDGRMLALAGALTGVGLLTRLTLVSLLPVLVGAAVVYLRRRPERRRVAISLAAVALPLLLLAPWFAFNLHHYDALTASELVRDMQEPVLNPEGVNYGFADLPDRHRTLLQGVLAEEWWSEFLPGRNRAIRDVLGLIFLIVPLALYTRLPKPTRLRAFALLVVPLLLSVLVIDVQLIAANWNSFYPRYLYPFLPAFALFAALGLRRVAGDRGVLAVSGAMSLALSVLWVYLAGVRPFVP